MFDQIPAPSPKLIDHDEGRVFVNPPGGPEVSWPYDVNNRAEQKATHDKARAWIAGWKARQAMEAAQ